MFTRWGDLVYRFRFAVIGVLGAAMLALGAYGTGLGDRLTQSGWFDPGSESVQGAEIADAAFGRDHMADVIVMYNAPEGKTIDDPEFQQKIVGNLTSALAEHPDQIAKINGTYWKVGDAPAVPSAFGSKDKKHAFASIAIVGDNDTTIMANYRVVADAFYIPGVDVEVSGLQPLGVTLNDTMAHDIKRMELLAIPGVAILLFFIFGGVVAAALPLIIGGLTILGATGIVMTLTNFTDVNSFVTGVVSMIGLGLAIDYGLFIVSRFREELAEGYDTKAAVRRSVMTAGRTVVFSATMIIASLGGVLLFPQGFLRSVAYGTIATVSLAALTAVTILPAMLAVLGPRVDMLGLKRFRKNKTAEEIENGFWGRLTRWVMRHPLKIAIPVTVGLLLLIIPVKNLAFGGINEKYLPPDNPTRAALEHFYEVFPQKKTDPIQLVFVVESGDKADTDAIGQVWKQANQAPGLVEPFAVPSNPPDDRTVYRTSATLVDPTGNAEPTIDYLRTIEIPEGVTMYVTGQPTLMADSIDTLLELMPWMILIVLFSTFVLMFLTFGSLVLPIKAALMSALGLGSTLGILTWIFIDGNGAGLLNFTPQPISAPVLMLIIAIIYGLSTDYEVFLLSRMVEARAQGASTTEAVRIGTAQTGRIITAAALILLVVTGAFAFSDMVMMQYIAYGMIAALFIDATVLRMLLVPAIMKLLGDDCWWAPKWMKRIQEKIGLGEPILDDERPQKGSVVDLVKTTPITDPPTMQLASVPDSKLAKTPRRPRTVAEIEAEAPTAHLDKITEHTDPAEPARPRPPMSPDPTRPRAPMLSGGPTRKPGAETPKPDQGQANPPSSGDPTQVLPIIKPDAAPPEIGRGQADSSDHGTDPKSPRGDFGSRPSDSGPGISTFNAFGDPVTGTPESGPTGDQRLGTPAGPSFGTAPEPRFGGASEPGSSNAATESRFGAANEPIPGSRDASGADAFGSQSIGEFGLGSTGATHPSALPGSSNTAADSRHGAASEQISTDEPRFGARDASGPGGFGPQGGPASGAHSVAPLEPRLNLPGESGASTGAGFGSRDDHSGTSHTGTPEGARFGAISGAGASAADDSFGVSNAAAGDSAGEPRFGMPGGGAGDQGRGRFGSGGNAENANGASGSAISENGVIGGGFADGGTPGVIGGELPSRGARDATPPPRGAERVQPPAGFTPPSVDRPSVPRVSTPDEAPGFGAPAEDSARPIVNQSRPSVSPPPGIVPPPAPSIVNPPPGLVPPVPRIANPQPPSIVSPTPRPVDPPAGGTFGGFTPVGREAAQETEGSAPEQDSRSFPPPGQAASGTHRAPAGNEPEADQPAARGVFGTPVPVEPQSPPPSWREAGAPTAANEFRAPDSGAAHGGFGAGNDPADPPGAGPLSSRESSTANPPLPRRGAEPNFKGVQPDAASRADGIASPVTPDRGNSATGSAPFDRGADPIAPERGDSAPNAATPGHGSGGTAPADRGYGTAEQSAPGREDLAAPGGGSTTGAAPSDRGFGTAEPSTPDREGLAAPGRGTSPTGAASSDRRFGAAEPRATGREGNVADSGRGDNATGSALPRRGYADDQGAAGSLRGSVGTPSGFQVPQVDNGARFAPGEAAAEQDSVRGEVRPQVAPPGFTAVPTGDSEQPRSGEEDDRRDAEDSRNVAAESAAQWQAPAGFTAVPTPNTDQERSSDTAEPEADAPQNNRNEIENWMAQLRSSRRGSTTPDEGRHQAGDGRTVSVNELLRRREDDAD
ncbi:MMPL family transporter [Nocardia asteroides]|uniref:MMPL family transporter n=1 Tax=Nocardia asteroides TaxID=1824 RepID=UPI001E6476E3|nr:MMPL family transporter [Nocardia asteroides]UGT52428.1 MMPL family transporter [Nocardia asteroides]